MFHYLFQLLVAFFLLLTVKKAFTTIDQASVGVVTMFGKYRRILAPGLQVLIPWLEKVSVRIPVQNQTTQLKFSAITNDQANVHFTATIIYTVSDHSEEIVKLVAFKFIDPLAFTTALNSAVEASVREFVSTKKQAEVLGMRADIVLHAKASLDEQLASWGWTISDLQINDIAFDPAVMESMSRVVAAKNAQSAAEFEGQALLIQRTKQAEAEGAAIRIAAENEAKAAQLRGEGLAAFRKAVAEGLSVSAEELRTAGVDASLLTLLLWTETLRDMAEKGSGNTIFLDGSLDGLDQQVRRLQAFTAQNRQQ